MISLETSDPVLSEDDIAPTSRSTALFGNSMLGCRWLQGDDIDVYWSRRSFLVHRITVRHVAEDSRTESDSTRLRLWSLNFDFSSCAALCRSSLERAHIWHSINTALGDIFDKTTAISLLAVRLFSYNASDSSFPWIDNRWCYKDGRW